MHQSATNTSLNWSILLLLISGCGDDESPTSADATSTGPSRIEAFGKLTVSQGMKYTLPSGRRDAYLEVEVEGRDDRGNVISETVRAEILPQSTI